MKLEIDWAGMLKASEFSCTPSRVFLYSLKGFPVLPREFSCIPFSNLLMGKALTIDGPWLTETMTDVSSEEVEITFTITTPGGTATHKTTTGIA